MSSVVLISDLLYQSAAIVFLEEGRVSEGLVMVSLVFHLFVVGTVIFASVLLRQVKNFFIPSNKNVVLHIKPQRQCTYVKRLTLKKYATTRSIAHITIYDKHKHNHYSHDTSSLELSQSMPKLMSATGSSWSGRIPVAISNLVRKFIRMHWNCRSNNANGSRVLS